MNPLPLVGLLAILSIAAPPPSTKPGTVPPTPPASIETRLISSVQVQVLAPDGTPLGDVAVALVGLTAPLVGGVTDATGGVLLQSPVGFPVNDGVVRFGFATGTPMPTGDEYLRLLARIERLTHDFAVPRWTPLKAEASGVDSAADARAVVQLKPAVSVRARIVRAPGAAWRANIFGTTRTARELDERAGTVTAHGVARGEPTTVYVGVDALVIPLQLTAEQTKQDAIDLGEFKELAPSANAPLAIELTNARPLRENRRREFVDGIALVAPDGSAVYTYYARADPASGALRVELRAGDARPPDASRIPPPGQYFVAPGYFIGCYDDVVDLLELIRNGRAAGATDIPVITVSDDVSSEWTIDLFAARQAIAAARAR